MKAPKIYLTNKELLAEVSNCRKDMKVSNKLGSMFIKMVNKYGTKSNFCSYTYLDDMKGKAIADLCAVWHKFDEERYSNAFAYYTSVIHSSFLQSLNLEKKQRNIKDAMAVDIGLSPSYAYEEMLNEQYSEQLREQESPETMPELATE